MQPIHSLKFPTLEETVKEFQDLRKFEDQSSELVAFDLIPEADSDREIVKQKIHTLHFESLKESKAFACFIAAAVGDALGAHLEGQPVDYKRNIIQDFKSLVNIKHSKARPPFGLFTDDTAQAICLADSIISMNYKFSGIDFRHRLMLWWFKGLNNGRLNDPKDKTSFGIGTNTMNSFFAFVKHRMDFAPATYKYTEEINSNGSIMRMASVPIAFHDDLQLALEFAGQQSRATHNGTEVKECCKLLTFLSVKFMEADNQTQCKEIMKNLSEYYMSENDAVQALIRSKKEKDFYNYELSKYDRDLEDRNWDWQADEYRYSSYRMEKNGDFVGIYCMDATAMALHIVFHTNTLKEAILRAVNLGGDCDSVGAVVGILAGTMYGYDEFLKESYEWVLPWDQMKIAIRAYKLFHKKGVSKSLGKEIKYFD